MILFFIEIISMNLFSFGKSFLNIDNSYPSVYILEYDMESVSVIYFILRLSGKVWCVWLDQWEPALGGCEYPGPNPDVLLQQGGPPR